MAYCTYQDVVDEFKSLDITSGIMTSTKITALIAQSDAYIDGRIGQIYEIPATGANSLLILKQISIGLTAERLANILRIKSATAEGTQPVYKDLIKEAKNDLKMIVSQELILTDATVLSSSGAVSSYSSENEVTRTFEQGKTQW